MGEALDGIARFEACMAAGGWREAREGRVPYGRGGAPSVDAVRAARSCAERSFLGTRYGRFEREAAACLERRGWRIPPRPPSTPVDLD